MSLQISETALSRLSRFLTDQLGLWFPRERFADLRRGLFHAAQELDFTDSEGFIDWLLSSSLSRRQIDVLASQFTTGETHFFRDRNTFRVMETQIIPGLLHRARASHRHLRFWSAGCASGEEAYSIAILLHKLIPDLADWNITILASDINPVLLKKAENGVYGEWSFRETPNWVKEQYFVREQGSHYRIVPLIKKMVSFSYLNLAEDSYPSLSSNTNAMNVIFCRNVLMYFEPGRARSAIRKFYRSLVDGGFLLVSPCDASYEVFRPFAMLPYDGAIIYRKDRDRAATADHPLRREPAYIPESHSIDSPVSASTSPSNIDPAFPPQGAEPDFPAPSLPEERTYPAPENDAYNRAQGLYEQGLYPEAAAILTGSASENSDSRAMMLLARALANQGKLAEAGQWCEKAVALDKINPDLHYLLAIICHELGRTDPAIVSLKRALYLDPDFVLAHFTLANINRNAGHIKESNRYFRNALDLMETMAPDQAVPGSDGLTAGRLKEIIKSTYRENGND